jgi:hypothetical protein
VFGREQPNSTGGTSTRDSASFTGATFDWVGLMEDWKKLNIKRVSRVFASNEMISMLGLLETQFSL